MLHELYTAPLSAWIGLGIACVGIGIGSCCIVANEIIKYAEREQAREDAMYRRAHGDWPSVPDNKLSHCGTVNITRPE